MVPIPLLSVRGSPRKIEAITIVRRGYVATRLALKEAPDLLIAV
jgi:hypothetical protein